MKSRHMICLQEAYSLCWAGKEGRRRTDVVTLIYGRNDMW